MESFISEISGKEFSINEQLKGEMIRRPIFNLIQKDCPQFNDQSLLSITELNYYRDKYISNYLTEELDELNLLRENVLNAMREQTTLTDKIELDDKQILTFGQKVADKVAYFGGSWTFIISFGVFLMFWIILNVVWFSNKGFDPYPFILLNLILSCIAALQAPVIMMSQNRQEEKDRERAKKDYMINLKSELEIRTLHEKLDHLIMHQQQELIEIQRMQIDMMNDILSRMNAMKS
jgi:uncharacterized membrane protein